MTDPPEEQAGPTWETGQGEVTHDRLLLVEREWTAVFDDIHDPIFMHDGAFRVVRANQAYAERAGLAWDEIIGRPYWEVFPRREGPLPGCTEATETSPDPAEAEFTLPDGTAYRSRAYAVSDEADGYRFSVHLLEDLAEVRGAQRELAAAERRFRLIFDNARDGIILADIASQRFLMANAAFCTLLGYRPVEIPDLTVADIHPAAALDYVQEQFARQVRGERSLAADVPVLRRDGTVFPAEVNATPVTLEGQRYLLAIFRDVSERKAAESTLARAHRALRTLSRGNEVLVHARDEQGLLAEICRTAVEEGGYRLAWVGYADVGKGSPVRPVARAGRDDGYVDAVGASWSDSPRGRGPTGRAIRERRPVVVRDIAHDASYTPWREAALARGYGSSAAIPLRHDQSVLGVLCLYAVEPDAFDETELKLLTELADNLAYGIRALRTGQAHELDMQRHQDLLYATIHAIALTVEKRDPYTAGHQAQVSLLATAIAREQGLEEDRIEGIRLGALIHDIGKVYIPAEILTRPGKLGAIEFELIKTHPEVGREIVADIPFPWPVAEMIHQHHERLDGSGYPQGLEGDAIIPEARILAVADVVEAVSSHRPYRSGLGMDKALEVVEAGRGTLFDPTVVDACLHLCHEAGFTFATDDSS